MKAAIYNPYIDSLGGGERYTFSLVRILLDKGYQVDIQWKDDSYVKKIYDRFGIKVDRANFIDNIKRGDGYDLCFWVSDGSVPTLRARNNILHFQVPFTNVDGRSLINKVKLRRINSIVCNSQFTKGFIDKEFGVDSVVIYPPVDVDKIKPKRKENYILYVGRFSKLKQSKNQDLLVRAFKTFYDNGHNDWKLILAGGTDVGVGDNISKLQKQSIHYPIKLEGNPSYTKIKDLYGRAKLFWSASGYGEDENKHPEKVEHFGISVVEAMAAKCIPFVCKSGGHREIIENGSNGFLWNNVDKLSEITDELVRDQKKLKIISDKAKTSSQRFSLTTFEKMFLEIL